MNGRTKGAQNRRAGAQQASIREHNLQLALEIVAGAPEPPSRADVAERAGLTRATAAGLVDQLVEGGLLEEMPPTPSGRAGRPATPLRLARGTVAGIGLEANVDYFGARAVDLAGGVLGEAVVREDLRGSDPARALASLAELAGGVARRVQAGGARLVGAALAVPGLVDHPLGPLRLAPNLSWEEVDVAGLLGPVGPARLVSVENEANLAARAELARVRAAGGSASFAYVSGEIGIGSAIVIDGRILQGLNGWAGELGHVAVDPEGPPCRCGSNGCLEQYAGKSALMAGAALPVDSGVDALMDALAAGSRPAEAAVDRAAQALGIALAGLVNITAVPELALGGDFAPLAAALAPGIAAELENRVLAARWMGPLLVTRPALAADFPALSGGALTCLDRVFASPASLVGPTP